MEKECRQCGGSGQEIVGENRLTLDMAIDAGDRSMEGAFHSYQYAPCDLCGGSGIELEEENCKCECHNAMSNWKKCVACEEHHKDNPMPTQPTQQEEYKPNEIANVINSLFLDSDYQGKDWEAVRKELTHRFSELKSLWQKETVEKAIDSFCIIVKNELKQQRLDGFSLDGTDFDAVFKSAKKIIINSLKQ